MSKVRGFELVSSFTDSNLLPKRETAYAAGYDLKAAVTTEIAPGEIKLVPTGVKAYMQITSIFQSPLYIICDAFQMRDAMYEAAFNEKETAWLDAQIGKEGVSFDRTLILVLVESFEDWVITPQLTPNLYAYMQTHPLFYADKVTSEIKGGGSADGQMIFNTGLLPLQYGAACFRFPNNVYPGIMHLSNNPAICIYLMILMYGIRRQ